MGQKRAWGRIATLGAALALMPLGLAIGQQDRSAGNDPLILKSRGIELSIDENLAIVKYVFTVFNPGARLLEGQVTFEAPGATGCELTLLRNISSTDRAGKIMDPKQAAAVYEAVRKHDLVLDDVESLDAIKFGPDSRPRPSKAEAAPEPKSGELKNDRGAAATGPVLTSTSPGTSPSPSPRRSRPSGDPALLEQVAGDTYRLRFFPVPAFCDETVTATFAVELREKSAGYSITLPLTADSRFTKAADTTEQVAFSLATRGTVASLTSQTHALPIKPSGSSVCQATVPIDGKVRTLQVSYTLSRGAQVYDFRRSIEEAAIVGPGRRTQVSADRAFEAVLVRSLVEALASESSSTADKVRAISEKAKIVTRHTSLIVIDRWEAEETRKGSGYEKEMAKEELEQARQCDYVRRLAGLPKIGRGDGCRLHVIQTTDASQVADAKKNGRRTWASTELPMFTCIEVAKHDADCLLKEQDPAALKRLAGLLDK